MAINPIYFQNVQERVMPDVMYKAPYEEIEKGNILDAQTIANTQSALSILESLLNQSVLPSDEDALKRSNEGYVEKIQSLSDDLMSGKLNTLQAKDRITGVSRELYKDVSIGSRSEMASRAGNYQRAQMINADLMKSNPAMYAQFMDKTLTNIQNATTKEEQEKFGLYAAVDRPVYDEVKDWSIIQNMMIESAQSYNMKDVDQDNIPRTMWTIMNTGPDKLLREVVQGYMKQNPKYRGYLQTLDYMNTGKRNTDPNYDVLDGNVFDDKHPLYEEALMLFNAIKKKSSSLGANAGYSARIARENRDKHTDPTSGTGGGGDVFQPPPPLTTETDATNPGGVVGQSTTPQQQMRQNMMDTLSDEDNTNFKPKKR
jgi:hypothetical protein